MAFWDFMGGGAGGDPAASAALANAQKPPYYIAKPGEPYSVGTGGPEDILTAGGLPADSGQAGGASGSNGLGQMSALTRLANALHGAGQGGTAAPSASPGATTPATPAGGQVPWDVTAPDAFAKTDRDRRQIGQYADLAGDIGKWVKFAAMAGA